MLLLLTVLLWVPMTGHCDIENLPGLEFLKCCQHPEETEPHQDDDCATDQCATVESGRYRANEEAFSVASMVSQASLAVLAVLLIDSRSDISLAQCQSDSPAPPEIATTWQFLSRAALPVRAPSLAS